MNIPWWKRWWSHLQPLVLEQASSEQNPELTVLLHRGRLQLLSGNAVYSWDDLYRNFTVALGRLELERRPEADVLLLGLGLGSVPFIFEKVYGRRYHYTVVEWDETVACLAARYTLDRLKSPVEIVTADAAVFIEVCEEHFDFVIVDIFEDDLTPPAFEEPDFLRACAERLRPGGLLLFNRLHGAAKDKMATDRFYERIFRRVFPDAWYIDTRGNWILCYERKA